MSAVPVIEFRGVEKAVGLERPLRVEAFVLHPHQRVVFGGLPGVFGEALMNLVTGATVPDAGDVIVFGTNTKDIRTDTEWLASLDRFGLVSNRAVLLDQSTIAQNLALPLTLAIDPIPDDVRVVVEQLARQVGLSLDVLDTPPPGDAQGGVLQRARMHLARAIAHNPEALLLEHPTATFNGAPSDALGATVRLIADDRQLTVFAVSDDEAFARAIGGQRVRVGVDGAVRPAAGAWRRFFGWGG